MAAQQQERKPWIIITSPSPRRGRVTMRYEPEHACFVENDTWRFTLVEAKDDPSSCSPRKLNSHEVSQLRESGYCVLGDALSEDRVERAFVDPIVRNLVKETSESGSWKSNSTSSTAVVTILDAVWPSIEQLFGCSVPPPTSAQVAVVGPSQHSAAKYPPSWNPSKLGDGYHIDGLHTPTNGIEPDRVKNFSLLVGVALTDVLMPMSGNFCVVPHSHHQLSEFVSSEGVDALRIPSNSASVEHVMDKILVRPDEPGDGHCVPIPLCCKRGTVYFAQYGTTHFVHPNFSPSTRVALYFRLVHPTSRLSITDDKDLFADSIVDPTLELPGLRV